MTTTPTTMRRVLVTGGNGQLGEAIRRAAEGSANSYTFATIAKLNICESSSVERYVTENKEEKHGDEFSHRGIACQGKNH